MKVKVNGVWLSQENVSTTEFLYGILPDFAGNNGKYLKLVAGHLVFASAGGGSFDGTMDDIDNGEIYVKTENNFTDDYKSALDGLDDALAGKSATSHNHGSDYAAIDHDHAGVYSPVGHNHDGAYSALGHNHSGVYEPVLTNGYGISGTTTKAIGLSNASAFATAETTISAATYADISGCSVSLAAGTWIIFAHVVARAANAIVQCFGAITHNDNTVISESANSRPASGTASLNSPISMSWFAIVTPGSATTYKLRGARGLTTHTGSWVAMDGTGVNTTNHATNNSDKGTGIFAVRIA